MFQLPLDIHLDDSARLDNFYFGDNAQLVKRLEDLKDNNQGFYFVWGNQTVGKSHLAQAICRELSEQQKVAVYIPLENQDLRPEVLDGLEFADLVCLDAFESIAGDAEWEVAIFDLFNRIKLSEKSLLIFSATPIASLLVALADLRSRLTSMEVYKLNSLSPDNQIDCIKTLGQHRGLQISDEVASFLMVRTERNVAKIADMIEKVDRQSLTHQRKITIPFVKQVLSI